MSGSRNENPPPQPPQPSKGPYVYRRVHPHGWNVRKNKPKESTFIAKPGAGLSVFRADMCSPRAVIEHGIKAARQMLTAGDEPVRQRGKKQLADFGDTAEQWLQHGWRVVRLPVSAFTDRGFTFDEPEPDGHQNVYGEHTLYSIDLVEIAESLTEEEWLSEHSL